MIQKIKSLIKKPLNKIQEKKDLKAMFERIKSDTLLDDLPANEVESWKLRIQLVKDCPDTEKIITQNNTATFEGDLFVMHNGIKIKPLSYYGYPVLKQLIENNTIHEPQEEYVFQEVLKEMPKGARMIELGAYWSFYSMWFNKEIEKAKNYMLEPWELQHGIDNFKINNLKGEFFKYYVAEKSGIHHDGSEIITIDDFVKQENIDFIDLLHSDIQGSELKMLEGAKNALQNKKVGYIFVSTHSNELHYDCAKFLDELGYLQVCTADIDETFSYDGLLVYKNPDYKGVDKIEISHKDKNVKGPHL